MALQHEQSGFLAGWYADPVGRHDYRYWDGAAWTDQVADRDVTSTDPVTAPPPAAASAGPGPGVDPGRWSATRWWRMGSGSVFSAEEAIMSGQSVGDRTDRASHRIRSRVGILLGLVLASTAVLAAVITSSEPADRHPNGELVTNAATGGVPLASDSPDDIPDPPAFPGADHIIEERDVTGPELASSILRETVQAVNSDEPVPESVDLVGRSVYVEVHHVLSEDEAESLIEAFGGETFGSVPGNTVALVPVEALEALEAERGIDYLAPIPPDPLPVGDEPSSNPDTGSLELLNVDTLRSKTNASSWHQAGITGTGVRVGIIDFFGQADWAAAQAAGRLPAPAGGLWCTVEACTEQMPWTSPGDHGVSSAEIVHAMAPGAALYIVGGSTGGEVREREVIDWLASKGVTVINRSLNQWLYSTPGDGTGWAHDNVAYAASKGLTWVNSAGNQAGNTAANRLGGHHLVSWDSNNNGTFLLTPAGSTAHPVYCSGTLGLSIRWGDWNVPAASRTDYDLFLHDQSGTLIAKSIDSQQLGYPPVEGILMSCAEGAWLFFQVYLYDPGSGTASDVIEVQAARGLLDAWSNPYSAAVEHVDSGSAAMIAAGAMEPLNGTAIAHYSSWGPTIDGRVKPDLSAGSCIQTIAAQRANKTCQDGTTVGASGTSASGPVIAGAAALVRSSGEASTPSQVKAYLLSHAIDRGVAGLDSVFGAGELRLPAPPVTADSTPPRWPEKTFVADALERQVQLSWRAATDDVGVTGYKVYRGSGDPVDGVFRGSLVATLNASARSYTVTGLTPGTKYSFWVEAFDEAGNQSTDGPLKVRSTAMEFVDTANSVFYRDIAWLSSVGVTQGCNPPTNTRFCPDDPVTRAQMASFLVRALGIDSSGFDFFIDTESSVHRADINTLAAFEITQGCNPPLNDRYCPSQPVLRGQMASFLVRALYLDAGWNIDYFGDDNNSVHEFDINRSAHSGITRGCNPPSNTRFCPGDGVTRGQMAAFLHRAADRIDATRADRELGPMSLLEESDQPEPDAPRVFDE